MRKGPNSSNVEDNKKKKLNFVRVLIHFPGRLKFPKGIHNTSSSSGMLIPGTVEPELCSRVIRCSDEVFRQLGGLPAVVESIQPNYLNFKILS